MDCLGLEQANYINSQSKYGCLSLSAHCLFLQIVFVNKVLLAYYDANSFTYCLWLLLITIAELNSFSRGHIALKA